MEFGTILALASSAALLLVPRRVAPAVFIFAALYCPMGAGISVASVLFPPGRLLATVGLARVLLRREMPKWTGMDKAALVFGFVMVFSGLFHEGPIGAMVMRAGYCLDTVGSYLVFRSFVQSLEEARRCFIILLILIVPLGIEMLWEAFGGRNLFSYLGALDTHGNIRKGKIRAQGPFRHAILAGTVTAALIPVALSLLHRRKAALFGLVSIAMSVFACASSGPLITAMVGIAGAAMFRFRRRLRLVLWSFWVSLLLLHIVMKDPVWFVIAKVNIVGGSTGWHRAKLIDSAISHLDEWWFAGTDYTRHWMSGHGFNEANVDITNYYIRCGVNGGLPLLITFIILLRKGLRNAGAAVKAAMERGAREDAFFCWAVGCWLFAYIISIISVNPYDQTLVLFFSFLAVLSGLPQFIAEQEPAVGVVK